MSERTQEKLEETSKDESREAAGGEHRVKRQVQQVKKKRRDKGRKGQTHLRGGESKSVRVSREGGIRGMTRHAGAAHRRANTLKVREKEAAYTLLYCR